MTDSSTRYWTFDTLFDPLTDKILTAKHERSVSVGANDTLPDRNYFREWLLGLGFVQSQNNPSVFFFYGSGGELLLTLMTYMDDCILACSPENKKYWDRFVKCLNKNKLTDTGTGVIMDPMSQFAFVGLTILTPRLPVPAIAYYKRIQGLQDISESFEILTKSYS